MNGPADVTNLGRYFLDHENLSDAQRKIAEYLCENPWEGLTQTAAEIGAVGEALVYSTAATTTEGVNSHAEKARDLLGALGECELDSTNNLISILTGAEEEKIRHGVVIVPAIAEYDGGIRAFLSGQRL